jgi:hypothetical protein
MRPPDGLECVHIGTELLSLIAVSRRLPCADRIAVTGRCMSVLSPFRALCGNRKAAPQVSLKVCVAD